MRLEDITPDEAKGFYLEFDRTLYLGIHYGFSLVVVQEKSGLKPVRGASIK